MDLHSIPVDVTFLAEYFERDERTIQLWAEKWREKYNFQKLSRGDYDFIVCVTCRLKDLAAEIERLEKGDETLYELQKEHQSLRNKEKLIQLRKLNNEIIDIEFVRTAWMNEMQMIKKFHNALITKISNRVLGVTEYQQVYNIVSEEIRIMDTNISQLEIIEDEIKTEKELEDIIGENNNESTNENQI